MKLTTIGIEVPDIFPVESYESVHRQMAKLIDVYKTQWYHYAGAWNAVGYRFIVCSKNNALYTMSYQNHGEWPPFTERYKQETALFSFFANGLSTIESFLYGLYAISSIIKPDEFSISAEKELKKINTKSVGKQFNRYFENFNLAQSIKIMLGDSNFKEWNDVRNILIHRAAYGRKGGQGGKKALWIKGIHMDELTTSSRYKWFVSTIRKLIKDMDGFVSSEINKVVKNLKKK